MKICPNCRTQVSDDAIFCPVCGTAMDSMSNFHTANQPPHVEPNPVPVFTPAPDPFDHTADFRTTDIQEHKLVCMLVYLLDFIGVFLALSQNRSSDYVRFHIRQSMKFTVVEILLVLATALLCWTVIVPIVGSVALFVLMVIKFISFVQVCQNKAKEPVLIRSLSFLN